MRLRDKIITEGLNLLRSKFVVVPVDKVSLSIAFVCYYSQIFNNVQGLNNFNIMTSIYMNSTNPEEKIVSDNPLFLKIKFFLISSRLIKNFLVYWFLKLHKNSTKQRYIIAALKWSVKPLPKVARSALKVTYRKNENYNFQTQY